MNQFKISLTLILILGLYFQGFGQAFSLEQLEKFNKMDMPTFKAEIKKLKYSYYDKTESSEFNLYEYDSSDFQYKIGKFEYINEKSADRVEFQFKNKREYDQYLKTITNLGYKKTETGKIPGGETFVDYFKNKSQIRFIFPRTGQENEPFTILVFK
ncbi:hypothetical protein [Chryseobacterium sp. JUb7]|uniref:hypothetical protein n=1 Tax=Chryseobacterium sp. JUb7 TaxID=2940599 RepID=UPI0021675240|nr:hypothetical protein [Chryseobacterium sp. JUb7]MCS3529743.1 hypothetical protein [Chryseobacterium sp. JUb7]